jgi:hypothetical protein
VKKLGFKKLGLVLIAAMMAIPTMSLAEASLSFSGGPEGGTFQYFSNGMATRLSKKVDGIKVSNMASAGSGENLRRVNSGEADFGIVYSGDTFLGRNGRLTKDTNKYENVHAIAYLYGAPAHLVTLADSGINSVADLKGKRVAVGGAGSGAANAAERFFGALGLWDNMDVEFLGYSKAASAMGDRQIDAFWVFAGFPNSSVIQAAASNKIKIISVADAGEKGGFFKAFPFYTKVTIPAGTYSDVDYEINSFQDSALWVANKDVDADIVANSVAEMFSTKGLRYMVQVKSTAKAMSIKGGLSGIVTPVHAGAAKFWTEQGLSLTADQSAK